jgi:hypothetical protein
LTGIALLLALAACGKSDDKGGFDEYRRKTISSEALTYVMTIARGAQAYYDQEHMAPDSLTVGARQLPGPSVGPTPPVGACCKEKGSKCMPDRALWEAPTWQAVMLRMLDPHYYSYAYELAEDGRSFTALAYGDIDCDGEYSTFSVKGTVTDEDLVQLSPVEKKNPLE